MWKKNWNIYGIRNQRLRSERSGRKTGISMKKGTRDGDQKKTWKKNWNIYGIRTKEGDQKKLGRKTEISRG